MKQICIIEAVLLAVAAVLLYLAHRKNRKAECEREKAEQLYLTEGNANVARREFLSRMSHEIRTPMHNISGMTAIAMLKLDDKQRVLDCLQKIKASSEYLHSLLNNILDMSKIENGKVELSEKPFAPEALFTAVCAEFEGQAREAGLNFVCECDKIPTRLLLGDKLRLKQILYNLLSNAVKFTPRGGQITLTVSEEEAESERAWLMVVVNDTGCGIEESQLTRIFEAYEQGSAAENGYGGTGLGLAITRHFVQLMGGTITASSILGSGTTFTVRLPFVVAGQTDELKRRVSMECEQELADTCEELRAYFYSAPLAGKCVLIVEDNPLNREITKELLETAGASILTAENGKEAIRVVEGVAPYTLDLILMDLQMPVMDGYEATREIRRLKRADTARLPIIAMSADAFAEDVRRCIRSGMNAHISKPIDVKMVCRQLDACLSGEE